MTRLALILFAGLIGCATQTVDKEKYVEWPSFDGVKIFDPLSAVEAKRVGKRLAEKDFKLGYYRRLYYGFPTDPSKPERRLYKNYGVRGCSVAGCVVTEGLVEGADSYNETMHSLINQKYGRDVFKESGFE